MQFIVKGTTTTNGCDCFAENIEKEDGLMIELLRKEGAIFFVKGNHPQVKS